MRMFYYSSVMGWLLSIVAWLQRAGARWSWLVVGVTVLVLVVFAGAAVAAPAEEERGFGLGDGDFHLYLECLDFETERDVTSYGYGSGSYGNQAPTVQQMPLAYNMQWRALNCPFPRGSYKLLRDADATEWGEQLSTAVGWSFWNTYSAMAGLVFTVLWNALTMPWVNFFVVVADRLGSAVLALVFQYWGTVAAIVGVVAAWKLLRPKRRDPTKNQDPYSNISDVLKFLAGAIVWLGLFMAAVNWNGPNPFEPDAATNDCSDHATKDPSGALTLKTGCVNGLTRVALFPITTLLQAAAALDDVAAGAVDFALAREGGTPSGDAGVWAPYLWGTEAPAAENMETVFGAMEDPDFIAEAFRELLGQTKRLQPEFEPNLYFSDDSYDNPDGNLVTQMIPCRLPDVSTNITGTGRSTARAAQATQDTPGTLVARASLMEPLACRVLQPWKKHLLHNVWESFHWGRPLNPYSSDAVVIGQEGHDTGTYPAGLGLSNGQTVALLLWGSSTNYGNADSELMHNLQMDGRLVAPSENGQHFTGEVLLSFFAVGPGLVSALIILGLMMYASFHILIVIGLIPAVGVLAPVPLARRLVVRMGLSLLRSGILVAGTLVFVNLMIIYQDVLFTMARSLPGVLAAIVAVVGQAFLLVVPFKLFTVSKKANEKFKARLQRANYGSLRGLRQLGQDLGQDLKTAGRETFGSGLAPAAGEGTRTISGKKETGKAGQRTGRGVFASDRQGRQETTARTAADAEDTNVGAKTGRGPFTGTGAAAAAVGKALAAGAPGLPGGGPGGPVDIDSGGGAVFEGTPGGAAALATGEHGTDLATVDSGAPGLPSGGTAFEGTRGSPDLATVEPPSDGADLATVDEQGTLAVSEGAPGRADLATVDDRGTVPVSEGTAPEGKDKDEVVDVGGSVFQTPKRRTRLGQALKTGAAMGGEALKTGAAAGKEQLETRTELGRAVSQQVKHAKAAKQISKRFVGTAREEGIAAAVKPPTEKEQRHIERLETGKFNNAEMVEMITNSRGGLATAAVEQHRTLQKQQQELLDRIDGEKTKQQQIRRNVFAGQQQGRHLVLEWEKAGIAQASAQQELQDLQQKKKTVEANPDTMTATQKIRLAMDLRKAEQDVIAKQTAAAEAHAKIETLPDSLKEGAEAYQQSQETLEQHETLLEDLRDRTEQAAAEQNQLNDPGGQRYSQAVRRKAIRQMLLKVTPDQLGAADRQLLQTEHRTEMLTVASRLSEEDQHKAAAWAAVLQGTQQ